MTVILMILKTVVKNLVGMLIGQRMVFWALELAAKQTDNAIDDNAVALIKAAYKNEPDDVRKYAELVLAAYKKSGVKKVAKEKKVVKAAPKPAAPGGKGRKRVKKK